MKTNTTGLLADSLYYSYGREHILAGIFFTLYKGEIVGILGRNGCGKTTFFKILMGILQEKGGIIKADGTYLPREKRKKYLAYLPQVSSLPRFLKVEKVLSLFLDKKEAYAILVSDQRISTFLKTKVCDLSGGERRYLELLLILALKKPYVLLDEPYSELEPLYADLVNEKIRAAGRETGFLITDHQHHLLRRIATRLYVMANNKLYAVENNHQSLRNFGYLPDSGKPGE